MPQVSAASKAGNVSEDLGFREKSLKTVFRWNPQYLTVCYYRDNGKENTNHDTIIGNYIFTIVYYNIL